MEELKELINDLSKLDTIKKLYCKTKSKDGFYDPKVKDILNFFESCGYVENRGGVYFLTDSGMEVFEMLKVLDLLPKSEYDSTVKNCEHVV